MLLMMMIRSGLTMTVVPLHSTTIHYVNELHDIIIVDRLCTRALTRRSYNYIRVTVATMMVMVISEMTVMGTMCFGC